MNLRCGTPPADKKEYITSIGKILVEQHGKQDFYTPEHVKQAHRQSNYFDPATINPAWAMCIFCSHEVFDEYHRAKKEECDYVSMRTEMLQGMGTTDASSWLVIPDIDIDASWLDFGEIFGSIVEGIGELVGGIADGIS